MSAITQELDNYVYSKIEEFAKPILAEITKVDHENYTCECIELTKDREKTNIIYPHVPIPKFWGTSTGGVFMAPSKETIVLLNFLDNDRNYPIVAAIMGSNHSEKSTEDTLIIKCGETEVRLDDKIFISAGGVSLGDIIKKMAEMTASLSTTISVPLTGTCPASGSTVPITTGNMELNPSQKVEWETLKSTKIDKIFT